MVCVGSWWGMKELLDVNCNRGNTIDIRRRECTRMTISENSGMHTIFEMRKFEYHCYDIRPRRIVWHNLDIHVLRGPGFRCAL